MFKRIFTMATSALGVAMNRLTSPGQSLPLVTGKSISSYPGPGRFSGVARIKRAAKKRRYQKRARCHA